VPWYHEKPGTVTQWAVEHTYDDGEKRYFGDWYDEAEARREAEIVNLNRAVRENGGGAHPVTARVVSRTVTYSTWT
jgi:hypothetical protein